MTSQKQKAFENSWIFHKYLKKKYLFKLIRLKQTKIV
jgi:hypothetical protein